MKHYETSFFCDKGCPPEFHTKSLYELGNTVVTELHSDYYKGVILFFDNHSDYIEFVNRVKADYERFRKEQGYGRL